MIWLIGGTSEAKQFVDKFPMSEKLIVSVTTNYGASLIKDCKVKISAMDYEEMKEFVEENNISVIIDMSHPFAEIVTSNAQKIAKDMKIKYLRYIRPTTCKADYSFKEMKEFEKFSKENKGTYFITVGSKMIGELESIKNKNRFIYRILPMTKSIEICRKYNIKLEDIVCMKGPFSLDMNIAFLKEFSADYMLMKDSGEAGGMEAKLRACEKLGINSVAFTRKSEEGIQDIDELIYKAIVLLGE